MKFLTSLLCCVCILQAGNVAGQPGADAASFPEIRIYVSKSQYSSLLESKGRKLELKKPVFLVNKDTAKVKEVHSRGNNSLTFERKSLSVDLNDALEIKIHGKKAKIKKFDLLNLVMDKNLWHNRWAFLNMADVSLFPLLNTFCTLWINDQPQGIYMLVEKPRHYTTGKPKSPYMLRRGVDHIVNDEYVDTPSKDDAKKYKQQYHALYDDIAKYKGDDLYKRLDSKLYMDHYYYWLAFNYLIMNGDYADELYLYILPDTKQFDIIPWDYDDILRPTPHEGMEARNSVEGFKNKMIFSSEDPLDRAIASDAVLYAHYLTAFEKLLNTLTGENLTLAGQKAKDELQSLSQGPAAGASMFLGKEPFNMSNAADDIDKSMDFIVKRRNALLQAVKAGH